MTAVLAPPLPLAFLCRPSKNWIGSRQPVCVGREYFVYILASRSRVLYVGITNNLERRVFEHKHRIVRGFTSEYDVERLVYFEMTTDVYEAICREKRIKGWRRSRKIALIEAVNPGWKDLSESWAEKGEIPRPSASE